MYATVFHKMEVSFEFLIQFKTEELSSNFSVFVKIINHVNVGTHKINTKSSDSVYYEVFKFVFI